jgi:hypothetical protein
MITGLIKYLLTSDRRDRGLGLREKGHPYRRLKQETD